MKELDCICELRLYEFFEEALNGENYELCAQIRAEYKRRFETHTFCHIAYRAFTKTRTIRVCRQRLFRTTVRLSDKTSAKG